MSKQAEPSADGGGLAVQDENAPAVFRPLLALVILAVVIGVIFRFVATSSLWLDEALSVNIASLPIGDIGEALRHDGHPPLYYLLLHFWMEVFGTSDFAVRALSGLGALVALPLAYLAGNRRGGRTGGLLTLALVALMPFAVRYATEARMYSLVVTLVFAGYLLLDDVVVRGRTGPARLIGLALISALLLYTHYWAMWLLAAVGLGLLWGVWRSGPGDQRRRRLLAVGSLIAGGVLFLPWVPSLLYQSAHTGTPWADPSRPTAAIATMLADFGGGGFRDADFMGSILLVLALLGLCAAAVDRYRMQIDLRTLPQYRREALVLVGTLLVAFTVAYVSSSAFAVRYAAVVFPLFVLLVAGGLTRFTDRWIQFGVVSLVLLAFLPGVLLAAFGSRSQTRAIADVVSERAQPGDIVLYCPDQLGPGGTRVMPDDVVQLSYPALDDPAFVDWVDYGTRNDAADPAAVATAVHERAAGQAIFVVWNGSYRTFEDDCEALISTFSALRPGGEVLVEPSQVHNFEYAELDYFPSQFMSDLMRRRWRMLRSDALAVLPAWLTARVLVAAAYVAAVAVADRLTPEGRPHTLTEGLIAWDGTWYRDIAAHGYGETSSESLRFFPLFPLIGRGLAAPFGGRTDVALVLVATIASFVLAVLVRRLMLAEGRSLRTADRAVWLMMLFPSAFVLTWGYAEAIMLVGAVGMFYGLRTKHWWWAAAAGIIAASSRPLGILLVLPAAIEVARSWRESDGPERVAGAAAVLSPLVGAAGYLLWVQSTYGNARLPFTVQGPLRGAYVDPFSRLWEGFTQLTGPERFGDALHLPFAIVFIVLLFFTFRRWPASYGVYAAATLLIAISAENLNSLERYALNAFPLVLTLAVLTKDERVERPVLTVCAGGFVALATLAWLGAYVP